MKRDDPQPHSLISTGTLIHGVELVADGARTPDAWVRFQGGVVVGAGSGDGWRAPGVAADVAADSELVDVDGDGMILTPGFIDLHMHGGAGRANEEGAEAMASALAAHRRHGTTRAVLSFVSAQPATLTPLLTEVAELADRHPSVLGSHLEGPFLSSHYRGAHDAEMLMSPTAADIDLLLEAARGTLRQVTLAPELPGAQAAITRLADAGTTVAVGHTSADFDTALAAFNAGASILTHAFNCMPGLHHRDPGPVGAALASPHVTIELINDGVHVHPLVAQLLLARAPGRVALITDAMAAACAGDGAYALGSLAVSVVDGVARLDDDGSIAGSTLTLDATLRQAVTVCGIELTEAVRALTATPAAAIGRSSDLGSLRPGFAADAVLLDRELAVRRVWVAGSEAPIST